MLKKTELLGKCFLKTLSDLREKKKRVLVSIPSRFREFDLEIIFCLSVSDIFLPSVKPRKNRSVNELELTYPAKSNPAVYPESEGTKSFMSR